MVTVFTPTYNRSYIIEKLYRSLQRQTCFDFEWLVVDDGSTDNTSELFALWSKECKTFTIRYFKQENQGKCQAINYGLQLAEGDLFFTVDSDDYLTNDAIEKVVMWEKTLPVNEKYCGFAGNLGTNVGVTPNRLFDSSYFDGTALDRYSIVDGERAMVFYTNVHRKYLYPKFENEKFMTEAITWNRMAADGYKIRFFNDIIWIYEYRDDGLTKAGNKLFVDNPYGYGLCIREKAEYLNYSFWLKIKLYYNFCCEFSDRLSAVKVAQCLKVPKVLIGCLLLLKKVRGLLRKLK